MKQALAVNLITDLKSARRIVTLLQRDVLVSNALYWKIFNELKEEIALSGERIEDKNIFTVPAATLINTLGIGIFVGTHCIFISLGSGRK